MLLRVVDDGIFRDIGIKEGEMFLLPGTSAPHAADTAEACPPRTNIASLTRPTGYTVMGLHAQAILHTIPCASQTLSGS